MAMGRVSHRASSLLEPGAILYLRPLAIWAIDEAPPRRRDVSG
jgi:hypothetical protein